MRYVGDILKWCCEHDAWRRANEPPSKLLDWNEDTVVLDEWESAIEVTEEQEESDALLLLWPRMQAFEAERGAAVGGSTVAVQLPPGG